MNVILLGEMSKRLLEPLTKLLIEDLVCAALIDQVNIDNQLPSSPHRHEPDPPALCCCSCDYLWLGW